MLTPPPGPLVRDGSARRLRARDRSDERPGAGAPPPSPGGPAGATLVDPAAGSTDVPAQPGGRDGAVPGAGRLGRGRPADLRRGRRAGPGASSPPRSPATAAPATGRRSAGSLPAGLACRVDARCGNTWTARAAPVPAGVIGIFDTAAAPDVAPPVLSEVTIAVAGPCLAVELLDRRAGERNGRRSSPAGVEIDSPAGVGQTKFDVAIPLGALPASSAATITVSAVDRAGNVASSSPLAFETPAALPPVAITEVLANAAGPEPAQEYVELRNLGGEAVPLAGLRHRGREGGRRSAGGDAGRRAATRWSSPRPTIPPRGRIRRRAPGRCSCGSTPGSGRTGSRTAARRSS